MAVGDRVLMAVLNTYDQIHASLLEDARAADRDGLPVRARSLRYQAAMVAGAAESEEIEARRRDRATRQTVREDQR